MGDTIFTDGEELWYDFVQDLSDNRIRLVKKMTNFEQFDKLVSIALKEEYLGATIKAKKECWSVIKGLRAAAKDEGAYSIW